MILFPVMILIAWFVIIIMNILINQPIYDFSVLYIIFAVIISTFTVIIIDGVTATVVRLMPAKLFNPFSKFYRIRGWEKKFYQKIQIKKWKDLVPELGHFTKFRKNKIEDPNNNEYIHRYLLEAVYGRVGHFTSFITGFLVIFIFPLKYALCFGVPIAIVNVIMNSMSWMILRFNTPKLMAIYKRNLRAEQEKVALEDKNTVKA